ncbi:MAG: DUF4136 domain-containing protein [Bacteroidetes bacterium]|jgi:hypothetical protein|nr:MAG: DUF4136 domain-containing protein [Bacteroidota bacterium]
MRSKLYQWVVCVSLFVLISCYPKGAEFAEDLDLVLTNYNQDFDFKAKHTYAIPDSVIKITGDVFNDPDGDHKPTFVDQTYANAILAAVNQNMTANGWTRVSKTSNPDVVLLASAMTTTNIYYYYDWWYWSWWYPSGCYCYGWYYPGYYPPYYVSGYRSGTVLVQMVDRSAIVPSGGNVPVEWTAIFNGLAEGSTSSITARIGTAINQAFSQSPYLKIN